MTKAPQSTLPPPQLIADHPGLEILNSCGAPYGTHMDWLETGEELLCWMRAAGFLTEEQTAQLSGLPAVDLKIAAALARTIRETYRSKGVGDDLVLLLNQNIAAGELRCRLEMEEGAPVLKEDLRTETAEDLLAILSYHMARLISEADADRLKTCDGPGCDFRFLDTSRNNRRRWCSMAICGNRAKAAAHRARQKDGSDDPAP